MAEDSGIEGDLANRLSGSDANSDVVAEKETAGRQMGITSVPTFIVAGQHVVQGAQPPDLWQQVIAELAEMQASQNPSSAAE